MKIYERTVSSYTILGLIEALDVLSIIEKNSDLPNRELLISPEDRVDESVLLNLWDYVSKNSKIQHYGLMIGQHIYPSSKGLLASLVSQCETLRDALEHFIENIAWMNPSESWEIVPKGTCVDLIFTINERYPAAAIERSMSSMIHWAKELTGNEAEIISVSFNFPPPKRIDLFHLIFGKELTFNSTFNCISVKNSDLRRKIKTHNPYLKSLLKEKLLNLEKKHGSLLEEKKLNKETVEKIIVVLLPQNKATIDTVSNELKISRQTLYRYLAKEKTSFKEILNKSRKDQSIKLLENNDITTIKISQLLGYTEVSSFYSAFKKWHGVSLGTYRKNIELNNKG